MFLKRCLKGDDSGAYLCTGKLLKIEGNGVEIKTGQVGPQAKRIISIGARVG